ncbi:MAG: HAD-IC family P-type ATPase [Verrucomicrobiota bacterium]
MLTGESLPIDKKSGDKLYAGTINVNGQLLMRVIAVGEKTALAHIIEAQRAQTSRASIQRLGDQVSSVFVPIVIGIALLTAAFWGFFPDQAHNLHQWLAQFLWQSHPPLEALAAAVVGAAAVLIVACPCAMGLATPVAIMAGTNSAAQRGILIRDGVALEKAGKITAVMFDKTGTLTQGKPAVAATEIFADNSRDDFELHLAAALARRSNHPLSQSVAKLFSDDLPFSHWQEVRGAGVEAEFNSETVRLGSLRWFAVSKASDVASEAADIILLKSVIHAIPEALGLARATLRTIKQNLFWAFFYNAAGIPLAALGFLSPVLCAAAMGFSDWIVIGNALRLRRWKLK